MKAECEEKLMNESLFKMQTICLFLKEHSQVRV